MRINFIYLIIFAFSKNFNVAKKYTNYSLYRAVPVTERHMNFLQKLNKLYDANYWREPGMMFHPIDFVISPDDRVNFLNQANKLGVYYSKIIEDVQRAFDKQTVMTYVRRQMSSMNWNNYYRLEDIYNWLTDLSKAYPQEVTIQNIGQSHENRQILALKVVLPGKPSRSIIIIEGGIHAREWISPAVVTYLINSIVNARNSSDITLRNIAHHYEWYFVPVLNPDGYEYSFTEDRQWRKNRNGDGIDLNRNFPHAHGTVGTSWNAGDENYCGQAPFSEKESLAIANLVKATYKRLKYYLSFHSYGQYMIIPYATTSDHKENYDQVFEMCRVAAERIFSRYKTKYEIGNAYETVGYMTSGVSSCWVKKSYQTPYVLTFELRDKGEEGFALPPEQILPTCEETLDGLLAFFSPNQVNYSEIRRISSGQSYNILDGSVFFVNVLLFIILRLD